MFCKIVCAVVVWHFVGAVPRADPLVDCKAGLIRGQAAADGDYNMFLGIPYAKVNEANPFGPSAPCPAFEDTFEAFDDSAICPQVSEFDSTKIIGTLDCLHLNVYVPTTASSSNRLPVLVWFHGGKFAFDFSGRFDYGPKFLVRHDVILVTFNFRLGPYGFICLNTPAVPGNQGLKDQLLALKWVKDNIEAFGGDANKITIFGESSGAAAIDMHVHLRQDNLFNQAILLSGTILSPRGYKRASNDVPLQISKQLGFVTSDVIDALSFLASVESDLVIASTQKLGLTFSPCVENYYDDVESFLTDYPVNLQATKIPLLIGFNNDECLIDYNDLSRADYYTKHDYLRDNINDDFSVNSQTFYEMSEMLRYFYFGGKAVNEKTLRQVLDFCLDYRYMHPVLRSLRKYFDSGVENIFSYKFSYVGKRNYIKYISNITYGGASHADQLSYLFDVSFLENIMPFKDQIVMDRMTALWTNFAKYGDPTPEATEMLPVKWVPATRDRWNYLNIDSELTMEALLYKERMAFLDHFYERYKKYQTGYREYNATSSVCFEPVAVSERKY